MKKDKLKERSIQIKSKQSIAIMIIFTIIYVVAKTMYIFKLLNSHEYTICKEPEKLYSQLLTVHGWFKNFMIFELLNAAFIIYISAILIYLVTKISKSTNKIKKIMTK